MLQFGGGDDGSAANVTWSAVTGSGTGDLCDLRGEGGFVATRSTPKVPFTLDYDFE